MYKKIVMGLALCGLQPLLAELSEYEKQLVQSISGYDLVPDEIKENLEYLSPSDYSHLRNDVMRGVTSNPLFRAYPYLQSTLFYISLGDLPTPVHYCRNLSKIFPLVALFIKNDGMTGKKTAQGQREFGGNKLRKLQYLLADALAHGHDTILTFGYSGSNHAVQTAICAKELGLTCICMLKPQPNSHIVQRNLLLQKESGSTLIFSETDLERACAAIEQCHVHKKNSQKIPYIIPTGGSTARGAIGYVQAAFELKEQIDAGVLSQPHHIYVTLGSGGTAAGLMLGCRAAGINSQFHLILDEPGDKDIITKQLHALFDATNDLLISLDPSFARYSFTENNYLIVDLYAGSEYGLFTKEGVEAISIIKAREGIELDGVYTGKCMSALIADLESGVLEKSTVLFWNTFCAQDGKFLKNSIDYHELPKAFHKYFQEEVQPLDYSSQVNDH